MDKRFDQNTPVIRGLSFDEDGGVAMEYAYPAKDMKASGLIINHTIYIPEDDYVEEIETIVNAAVYLLRDALDDFSKADSIEDQLGTPDPDDDDEDD